MGSHAEKQYVLKTLKRFRGILVGSNLLESTPGATVSLALAIIGKLKRQFAIDPMTYVFGMNLSYIQSETIDRTSANKGKKKVDLKKSFSKLARLFGKAITASVIDKRRPVRPADFDASLIKDLARTTYDYQVNRMREIWQSDPQFADFAMELTSPSFTFAPYFFTPYGDDQTWEAWHELNVSLAAEYAALDDKSKGHAIVCIGPKLLTSKQDALSVTKDYIDAGSDALWFWFSTLSEEKITAEKLKVLIAILDLLNEAKKKVYNLHGGFWSALLSKKGMTGFSHGVGYGESKDVTPVIGVTVPTVNYHLPPLHVKVPILEVERALGSLNVNDADDFHERICDCTVCRGVLNGDLKNLGQFGDFVLKVGNTRESQTPDSAKKCRFHFLLARAKEIDKVGAESSASLKAELAAIAAQYVSLPAYLGLGSRASHLKIWNSFL